MFRLPPPSLRIMLIGAVLVPFLAATALAGWYSIRILERHAESRMQEDIGLVARALRQPLSHALERGREGVIDRALKSAFDINRVYGVYVYDENGETIAIDGTTKAGMDTETAADIATRGEQRSEFGTAGSEEVFSYFVPLVDRGGRVNGLLQVTRQGADFDRYIRDVRTHTAGVFAAATVSLMLIILFGHGWVVGRHLKAMEDGLLSIGAGDLRLRLKPRGPRELRLLAASVNRMLTAIARSRDELEARRRREEVLTERLHQSEKMAAVGQLAAGIAHELGTPLSTVDGNAQRLLRREDLPERSKRQLRTVRTEVARMERIIRQLLDFGRNNPLERNPIPADRPLRAAMDRAEPEAESRGIRMQLEVPDHPPAVAIDAVRLEQALGNLLLNAAQAATNTVRAGFDIGADGSLSYWVEDDGPGIPEPIHDRLFEPFFTTKPVGNGTGLGLAVAHAAVRDHRGTIETEAREPHGVRFRVTLPAHESEDVA